MTFREAMIQAMTSRGMFDSQAIEIIDGYIKENKDEYMATLWDQDTSGYPENIQSALWVGVKGYAYNWILTNAPQAWFRPMFEYSDQELSLLIAAKKGKE